MSIKNITLKCRKKRLIDVPDCARFLEKNIKLFLDISVLCKYKNFFEIFYWVIQAAAFPATCIVPEVCDLQLGLLKDAFISITKIKKNHN